MHICPSKLEFFSFSRFSSRFMLLALIILFYALFSYSGCKRKLRSFIGELIGVPTPPHPPSFSCLSKASGAVSADSQRQNVSKGQAVEPLCTN